MAISRVHETISIHSKGKGVINKVKVPYIEMKKHDIDGIITDIKRLKTCFKNTKSLNAVLEFLENNCRDTSDSWHSNNLTISSEITKEDRSVSVMRSVQNGCNEKSIIRTDYEKTNRPNNVACGTTSPIGDRCVNVINSVVFGMNNKSIIRTDRYETNKFTKHGVNADQRKSGDRSGDVIQSICFGMNEKDIIKQRRDHYATIHPTQKPVRLLERLLALVSKEGDLVLDPFSGSGSTAIAAYNTGRQFVGFEIDKEYYEASIKYWTP
jgi:site-specific DNA-methyltransferase (adenine-specific)